VRVQRRRYRLGNRDHASANQNVAPASRLPW
jgi:hypothetical protein